MDHTDDVEPPRLWVEAFYASEAEVRGVLDGAREAHVLGEYETVREQLRSFASAERGIFKMVALTVLGIDQFFEDVDAQYEDAASPTEELRTIGAEYDRLSDDLQLVLTEQTNDLYNPAPKLSRGYRYSESVELPRLDYDLYSGDVKLCQFVHPPSQSLMLARSIVASTRELLEQVQQNEDPIATDEQKRMARQVEQLEEEVQGVEILGIGDEDSEAAEDTLDEAYYDPSFH